jgi:hypothetical protein
MKVFSERVTPFIKYKQLWGKLPGFISDRVEPLISKGNAVATKQKWELEGTLLSSASITFFIKKHCAGPLPEALLEGGGQCCGRPGRHSPTGHKNE